ncbi:hypothetical protein Acr_27g0001970 [Actinidia rufa]|uniref:Uncharacterized protein n=1 Tax=Actinidia rufa TaxID=165716 RepID=A0A7J0H602_9ERIC|nr:hypothetical protein Acr_27g0001970 [Actinidia rufa]
MSSRFDMVDLENSLPSWISDHLGEKSYMDDEVTRLPSSPKEDPSSLEGSPSVALPPIETRPKRIVFGEYPSNVKGWKKNFFVSGDNWEFPKGFAREAGAPRVPRLWGTPSKHCNKVSKLFGDDQKRINLKKLGPNLEVFKSKGLEVRSTPVKGVPTNAASPRAIPVPKSRDGFSANPVTALGPRASFLGRPSVAKKILSGVVPPVDKEKVEKLTLDQTIIRFYHAIGQQAVVFGSSLAIWSREAGDKVTLQHGRVASLEGAIADKLTKSEILVAELRKSAVSSKKLAVEAFKFFDEFLDAVEAAATKYFGEGFDFCKRQLRHHHPDLAIDLEGMDLNHDLLDEEEWEGEQGDVEAEKKDEKKKEDEATSTFSP